MSLWKKEIGTLPLLFFLQNTKKHGIYNSYENDISHENNKNYYVKTEHALIDATIRDFN